MSVPYIEFRLAPAADGQPQPVSRSISGEALQSSSRAGDGSAMLQVFGAEQRDGLAAVGQTPDWEVELQASTGGGADAEWSRLGRVKFDDANWAVTFPTVRGAWYRVQQVSQSRGVGDGLRCIITG